MKQKYLPLLTIVGLVAVLLLAMNVVEAENREAAPGQIIQSDKAGGADCASPAVITGVDAGTPFTDNDNSCGAASVVSNYQNATCNAVAYPGPELIYEIELLTNNMITVDLTPSALVDMGVFMVSDCTTPTSCVDFHDAIGAGVPSQIPRLQVGAYPAGTYFLYVDSYYPSGTSSCGDYTLTVSGSVPVELISFSVE